MKCPQCGKRYHLKNYPFDEVYFECEKCEVELALSEREMFDVDPRRKRRAESLVLIESLDEERAIPAADRRLSSKPLTLWVVLLFVFVVGGTASGVHRTMSGDGASGVVTLLFDWLILFPAAVGVSWRRKFGLALSIIFLALLLFGSASMVVGADDNADGLQGVRSLAGFVLGVFSLAWLLWFGRNTHLFSSPTARNDVNVQDKPPGER